MQSQNQNRNGYGQPVKEQHENMGLNPAETPWHPQNEPKQEKEMTDFNEDYFKN
jgi:hypothetical protein